MNKAFIELDNISKWIAVIIDITANDPKRWLGMSKPQLPTFEYFKQNVINDPGGKYDFTVRRYSTPAQTLLPIDRVHFQYRITGSTKYQRSIKYSYWKGTPFNYLEMDNKQPIN